MLDTLKSTDFEPYIGSAINVAIPGGTDVIIKLEEVTENKNAMMPRASEDTRIPFSLLFEGPLDSAFESGCYDIEVGRAEEHEKPRTVEHVYICRIAPLSNEAAAWYEIIFN